MFFPSHLPVPQIFGTRGWSLIYWQLRLMEESLHHLGCKKLVNNGINYQPQPVSRISEPSTVGATGSKIFFGIWKMRVFVHHHSQGSQGSVKGFRKRRRIGDIVLTCSKHWKQETEENHEKGVTFVFWAGSLWFLGSSQTKKSHEEILG